MKTKDLLREWKSFLTETAIIPLSQITQTMIKKRYTGEDIDNLSNFWTNNNYLSKYSHVILNDIEKGEPVNHILNTIKQHYFKVYQGSGPKLKDEISSGNISCDDLIEHLNSKTTFNKREIRQQCNYRNGQPVVGTYQDFDVIYSESDWIVIEPKTIQGSISWTHGKPDGSEETDQARRSDWCTGVTTENNMFPTYAGNLHMFYFISTDYETNRTLSRRLCLSFEVKDGEAKIAQKSSATVDANNDPISESKLRVIIKEELFSLIESIVSKRKTTSFEEIYSKATLSQIIRQLAQIKKAGDEEVVRTESFAYIKHSNKKEVIDYFYNKEDTKDYFFAGIIQNKNISFVREYYAKIAKKSVHFLRPYMKNRNLPSFIFKDFIRAKIKEEGEDSFSIYSILEYPAWQNLNFKEFKSISQSVDMNLSGLSAVFEEQFFLGGAFSTSLNSIDKIYHVSFIQDFVTSKASKENPKGMYLYLKSVGLDLGKEYFEDVVFENEALINYDHIDDLFNEFGYDELNENFIRQYIRLMMS